MLDIKNTAKQLERLILKRQDQLALPAKHPEVGINHLTWMCRQIYNGFVTGQTAHLWLGYIQGAITAAGGANLKEIQDLMQTNPQQSSPTNKT